MDDEVATLACSLLLEHIDEHDVYHRLYQDVRTVGAYVVDTLHPIGVIVVFLDAELQSEGIAK